MSEETKSSKTEPNQVQSIKELEWLAHFYVMHGRKDLALKIGQDLKALRSRMKIQAVNNIEPDSSDFASAS